MRVGVGVKFKRSPRHPRPWQQIYEECIEYARAADRLGFDYIVVPEHHSVDIGYNPAPFATLVALARETERIRLATQPLLLPLHHPVHVAEQLAALDVLSGGRAMLGVGAGYRPGDFEAFGIPRRERGPRTEEGLAVLLGALRERDFAFEGRFYSVAGVDITPRPLQEPHPPVFVTARSRAASARAARFGLGINTLFHEGIGGGVYSIYCAALEAAGVDPASVDFTIVRNGYLAETVDEAVRIGGPYIEGRTEYMTGGAYAGRDALAPRETLEVRTSDGRSFRTEGELVGTPQTWLDTVEADIAALDGPVPFGGYTLGIWPEGMRFEDGLAALELFAERVLPEVHALG